MALFTVPHVKISGLAASAPAAVQDNKDFTLLSESERELFIKTVGIRYRRVAPSGMTASDLCQAAAERLLSELRWNCEDIKALVFVTQTPDYIIPNTSSLLQEKLGLPKSCIAFDVNLGCSGYVYGLSIVGSLLQNQLGGKALLLVGDISTQTISMEDKSTAPLFSDAGSATALEYADEGFMHFNLQTDGREYDDIIIEDGGYRNRFTEQSLAKTELEKGVKRSRLDMKLDGVKIFNFALREIAPNINELLHQYQVGKAVVDYFVFHQANLLMLESVRRKMQVEVERVPYSLYDYGNTSSATIPVTLITKLREKLSTEKLKLVLSGFGVGLSWGSVYLETERMVCPQLIEL